jgi:hypothetical protein
MFLVNLGDIYVSVPRDRKAREAVLGFSSLTALGAYDIL